MAKEETQKDLGKLTKTKLVEEAKKYPAIVGAHGMDKEHLLEAIREERKKLGEEVPAETEKKPASARKKSKKSPPDRAALKAALRSLKEKRREALEAKDGVQLKRIRRRYKRTNRILRRLSSPVAG